ncbi:MAG: VOC family protein [Hyphomicrobiaceae bacterium]
MSNHGKIWWTELNTWNAEEAIAYYGAVMGWDFDTAPTAGTDIQRPYYIASKDGQPVAGIFTLVKPMFDGVPEHWFTYLAVDNLQQAIADSNAHGGRVQRQPFEIPGVGMMAVVADSNGAVMALIEPNQQASPT